MTRPRVLPATLVVTIDCCRSRGPRQDALAALVPTSFEACDERAGTQVVELGEQRLALGIEGGTDQQSGHGLPSTEQRSRPNHQGGCPPGVSSPKPSQPPETHNRDVHPRIDPHLTEGHWILHTKACEAPRL